MHENAKFVEKKSSRNQLSLAICDERDQRLIYDNNNNNRFIFYGDHVTYKGDFQGP